MFITNPRDVQFYFDISVIRHGEGKSLLCMRQFIIVCYRFTVLYNTAYVP